MEPQPCSVGSGVGSDGLRAGAVGLGRSAREAWREVGEAGVIFFLSNDWGFGGFFATFAA